MSPEGGTRRVSDGERRRDVYAQADGAAAAAAAASCRGLVRGGGDLNVVSGSQTCMRQSGHLIFAPSSGG